MLKIAVGSENPVKLKAVKDAFIKVFSENIIVKGFKVDSGVSDQPMSDSETLRGAKNRVKNLMSLSSNADFYIGIEGGVELVNDSLESFAWVFIQSNKRVGYAKTGSFFLSNKIKDLILSGKELGEADDIIFNIKNSKQNNGAIGILTKNVLTRASFYSEAVVLALIPFINKELY